MNRAAGGDLIALGEGFTTEFMRAGHVRTFGREMRACAGGLERRDGWKFPVGMTETQ